MNSRVRLAVLFVSAPIVLLVAIGGFLGKASARGDDSYQHLRVFEDVVSLILNNYVEGVNSDRIMKGAMEGLAEGLDPDSAYLTPTQVTTMMRPDSQPKGGVGLELTRQYYLRVISAREGSAAARAGLLPGDFVRAIDDKPTREMSALVGLRLLRGAPGHEGLVDDPARQRYRASRRRTGPRRLPGTRDVTSSGGAGRVAGAHPRVFEQHRRTVDDGSGRGPQRRRDEPPHRPAEQRRRLLR